VCAGNGLQGPHSPGQATFEPETVAEEPDLGYREAALDCCSVVACNLEIKVPESGGRREKEMPKCLKSSVKYPQSVMVWGTGVGPLCFIKGRGNAAIYQEILEHFMFPSTEKLYGDEDFIFQHDLAPAHSAKTTGKWFTDHGITAAIEASWASITPQQCLRLIASMPTPH